MRRSAICAIAAFGVASALPALWKERSSSDNCVGIGISVCDPINVAGTQNSNNNDGNSSDNDGTNNDCLGIGISACDPINVNGTQNSGNDDENSKQTSSTPSSSPTTKLPIDSNGNPLLNISPQVSPDLDLSSNNDCFGVGISACDPINVNGTQGSENDDGDKKQDTAAPTSTQISSSTSSGGDSLINISPTISPDLDFSSENDCFGLGISACDPINVNGVQNSGNDDDESKSSSSYSTKPQPSIASSSTDASSMKISPNISPDLDLSSNNDCIGVGISVCDPINVNGTQNSNNNNKSSSTETKEYKTTSGSSTSDESLINISPTTDPDLDLASNNDCFGVGISACDPINVNGKQGSNNDDS
ncbi:hypothetical protein F5Y16DRAFT_278184 [Xylariaceae sp. FL0255]|nr:hypothetical protein F5Y16DRAFT_278184 [Xylariaceae sp. FL0255]